MPKLDSKPIELLERKHVIQAVTALTMYLGTSGNVGKVDLYKLLDAVLLDPERNAALATMVCDVHWRSSEEQLFRSAVQAAEALVFKRGGCSVAPAQESTS